MSSLDESPIEKVPGLDNTKSGIQTSQRDQPNATKQTVTNPIPLSQRLGTLNDLNKNIAPTGNGMFFQTRFMQKNFWTV